MVKSSKYKHVGDNIITIDEYNNIQSFKHSKLVEGATVSLTGYSLHLKNHLHVSSQNGHSFSEDEINKIKQIAQSRPKNQGRIADILSTLKIDYDDISGTTKISGLPYNNLSSYMSMKIVIDSQHKTSSWVKINYSSDDWLFVDKITVAADDYRWTSPNYDFKRDNGSGKIWEWNTSRITEQSYMALKNLSKAKNSRIRFNGRDYYNDYTLTDIQQNEIASLIELHELLTN